ncbi:26556_t:CDS:2, partial [Gigaspora margarita]
MKENQNESNENINTIDETIETIDLTTNQSSDNFSFTTNSISFNLPISNNNKIVEIEAPVTIEVPVTKTLDVFITLVCYNKFEKPNKKLDGALAIPFNPENIKTFGNIEEEILSRNLPKQWGKIEIGRICYQTSSTSKADHCDLKSDDKTEKNVQLCVYQEPKNKITHNLDKESDQSNSNSNKKIRVNTLTTLNIIKKNIYDNLPACSIHIQGCLISEDGRHLKLDSDAINLWA